MSKNFFLSLITYHSSPPFLSCHKHGRVVSVAPVVAHQDARDELRAALGESGVRLYIPGRADAVACHDQGRPFGPRVGPDAQSAEPCAERPVGRDWRNILRRAEDADHHVADTRVM